MTCRCFKKNTTRAGRKGPAEQPVSHVLLAWFAVFIMTALPATHTVQAADTIKKLHGPVFTLKLDSTISPGSRALLEKAIRTAGADGASCLVVFLDTPGGLVASLRKMVQAVMQSPVPVIIYVYPPGAQAASAGAILTISAHVAAMAPGTNIGAAHPVGLGHNIDSNSTMGKKMENDLAAMAAAIARKRGRNVQWAEDAVRKSASVSADTALKLHVVDMVVPGLKELLAKVKGLQVELAGGKKALIYPNTSSIRAIEPGLRERILVTIADPNIAYVLMMIGMVGLYFELAHPGAIFPGVSGAISLVLAFFALQTLSASITGILLMVLAFILFVLELFITSHGVLGISGVVALFLGSVMLFDSSVTGLSIATSVLWPTLIAVSLFFSVIVWLAAKASLARPRTGTEGLIGEKGVVKQAISGNMFEVFIHGELWRAYSLHALKPGQTVTVESVEGLTLRVKPQED